MTRSIMVVAAHPDDEVLGCGGAIAKFADGGASVHVVLMADGVFSRKEVSETDSVALSARRAAAEKACEILGVKSLSFEEFPDNRLDTIPLLELAQVVEDYIDRYQPDCIFTHHSGDLNLDHRQVHEAVMTACRPQIGLSVKTILCFEVASSTEWRSPSSNSGFCPNWFIDISETLETKIFALEAYKLEMRDWPHPRSLKALRHLAHWRGAIIGADAAEAFVMERKIS